MKNYFKNIGHAVCVGLFVMISAVHAQDVAENGEAIVLQAEQASLVSEAPAEVRMQEARVQPIKYGEPYSFSKDHFLLFGAPVAGLKQEAIVQMVESGTKVGVAFEHVYMFGARDQLSPLYDKQIKLLCPSTQRNLYVVTQDAPDVLYSYSNYIYQGYGSIHMQTLTYEDGSACTIEHIECATSGSSDYLFVLVASKEDEKKPLSFVVLKAYNKEIVIETEEEKQKREERKKQREEKKKKEDKKQEESEEEKQEDKPRVKHEYIFIGVDSVSGTEGDPKAITLDKLVASQADIPSGYAITSVKYLEQLYIEVASEGTSDYKLFRGGFNVDGRFIEPLKLFATYKRAQTEYVPHRLEKKPSLNTFIFQNKKKYMLVNGSTNAHAQSRKQVTAFPIDKNDGLSTFSIGGSVELPGPISYITSLGETVYVAVASTDTAQLPGIFYSQAIIDGAGNIAAWTPWQRTAGVTAPVVGMKPHGLGFIHITLQGPNADVLQLSPTEWRGSRSSSSAALKKLMGDVFKQEMYGVKVLYDVPATNTNLASYMIAGGYQRLLIAQTACVNSSHKIELPQAYETIVTCTDGTLKACANNEKVPQAIVCTGGVLDELGFIDMVHIAKNGTDSWLCVGGPKGVAILRAADGKGMSADMLIGNQFAGLDSEFSFKRVGSYKRVRAVSSDANYLYITTDDRIDRIDLNRSSLKDDGILSVCTLATAREIVSICGGYVFNDACISHGMVLIATSHGLVVSQAGIDCRTVSHADQMKWQQIPLPSACSMIARLVPMSSTGNVSDVALQGQVYVVATSVADETSSITRLYLDVAHKESPVMLVPEAKLLDSATWLNYRYRINAFSTDGNRTLVARSRFEGFPPDVVQVSRSKPYQDYGLSQQLFSDTTQYVNCIACNSATGTLFLAADDGIRIYE